jgi:NAD(P)-dependent dehydrogenase (short-subunit alcohol dehydrogenase family)
MDLNGHTAIISGALGDIGRALTLAMAKAGAGVALCDLHESHEAEEILRTIRLLGPQARYDRVDVSDANAVEEWFETVEGYLGTPDLIIPNAAIVTLKDIRTITPDEWNRELSVNLNGACYMAQSGARRLLEKKQPGRIVFVGSWAGHRPHQHIPAYCAAKAGLRMLCQCMALDLAPDGILVNEVAPGYVDAGLTGRIFQEDPKLRERALEGLPTHELIQPEEVADQVLHLCDPKNRHMTGGTLLMDGGLSQTTSSYQGRKSQ